MSVDENTLHRHSIRIPGYDYTQAGTYLFTVVTKGREYLFGDISNGMVILNGAGAILHEEWERTAHVRPGIRLEAFVVMPDHFHGLFSILEDGSGIIRGALPPNQRVGEGIGKGRGDASSLQKPQKPQMPRAPLPRSVGAIVGQFKSITTKRINQLRGTPGAAVWQRNYHERIIRNEADFRNSVNYILSNPEHWRDGKPDC